MGVTGTADLATQALNLRMTAVLSKAFTDKLGGAASIGGFMNDLFRQGAFQGQTPKDAYFVQCDSTTTLQTDIDKGIVNIYVGFAPVKPAEFVILYIQPLAGQAAM